MKGPSVSYEQPTILHADLSRRAVVDTNDLPWVPSPQAGIERRMLDRDGGEVARATSIVRFAAGHTFPKHQHGGGEEFFVLEGTFSDQDGDASAGTYVRNPPGTHHAPWSDEGCTILVKLRQMRPAGELQLVIDSSATEWQTGVITGHWTKSLFTAQAWLENVSLEKLDPGTQVPAYLCEGGEEIFVVDGSFADDHGSYAAGVWQRNPHGFSHGLRSDTGCTLWVKRGHLSP